MLDLKKNICSESFWLKTLYLIVFYTVYRLLDLVVLLLLLMQWGSQLTTGKYNDFLSRFGISLACYMKQLVGYLAQASDEKPYPFSAWPDPENAIDNGDVVLHSAIENRE